MRNAAIFLFCFSSLALAQRSHYQTSYVDTIRAFTGDTVVVDSSMSVKKILRSYGIFSALGGITAGGMTTLSNVHTIGNDTIDGTLIVSNTGIPGRLLLGWATTAQFQSFNGYGFPPPKRWFYAINGGGGSMEMHFGDIDTSMTGSGNFHLYANGKEWLRIPGNFDNTISYAAYLSSALQITGVLSLGGSITSTASNSTSSISGTYLQLLQTSGSTQNIQMRSGGQLFTTMGWNNPLAGHGKTFWITVGTGGSGLSGQFWIDSTNKLITMHGVNLTIDGTGTNTLTAGKTIIGWLQVNANASNNIALNDTISSTTGVFSNGGTGWTFVDSVNVSSTLRVGGATTIGGDLIYSFTHGVSSADSISYSVGGTANTYYKVNTGLLVTKETRNLTIAGDSIQTPNAIGDYWIAVSIAASTSNANDQIRIRLKANNAFFSPELERWTVLSNGNATNIATIQHLWYLNTVPANAWLAVYVNNLSGNRAVNITDFGFKIWKAPEQP